MAILQSNYIPWKGYFDIINSVDEFILYDTVQYTKNDWRNRNLIKTNLGLQWLTIPVNHSINLKIIEVKAVNSSWRRKHWNAIKLNYIRAKHFKDMIPLIEEMYLNRKETFLSEINFTFLTTINNILGIKTKIRTASEFDLYGDRNEKLIHICKQCNASEYYSGPNAKNYINNKQFEKNGIKVSWMDYNDYPQYNQLFPPFMHNVSILDLLFNEGTGSINYMKSFL